MFFSDHDQGHPYLIDTIEHEGEWWLVASWLEPNEGGELIPGRLVRLSGLQYQEETAGDYRFLLNNSIPKSVFDGEEHTGYVTLNYPGLSDIQGPSSVN